MHTIIIIRLVFFFFFCPFEVELCLDTMVLHLQFWCIILLYPANSVLFAGVFMFLIMDCIFLYPTVLFFPDLHPFV
jgi:hypothetical protein